MTNAFLRECRKYVPELEAVDFQGRFSGIRAQAVGRDGALIDDFKLLRRPGLVHVANAPSPAATTFSRDRRDPRGASAEGA